MLMPLKGPYYLLIISPDHIQKLVSSYSTWILDFQTSSAGPGEDFSCRFRIRGPKWLCFWTRIENKRKTKKNIHMCQASEQRSVLKEENWENCIFSLSLSTLSLPSLFPSLFDFLPSWFLLPLGLFRPQCVILLFVFSGGYFSGFPGGPGRRGEDL